MCYVLPYNQLASQVHKVLGKKAYCVVMDDENAIFPDVDSLTLILSNDVQSRLLLLRAAKEFSGNINVVNLKGEFTDHSPLAVSDAELMECCKTLYCISGQERSALIEEYENLPESKYYQLQDEHIAPLSQEEITKFILQQITEPIKMSVAVGLCMGYSPKGWPRTDTFYFQQIEELAERGLLAIEGTNRDMMQKTIRPLKTA